MQALEGRGTETSTKTSSLWVVFMETIMHNLVSHNKDGFGIMNGNPSHNNVTEEGLLPFVHSAVPHVPLSLLRLHWHREGR